MNGIEHRDDDCLQEEPVASIFRERERSGSRKRGGASERMNLDDKDPTKLFVEELQDGSPYGALVEVDDDDYLTALQSLYDRYRAGRGNKVYEWVRSFNHFDLWH